MIVVLLYINVPLFKQYAGHPTRYLTHIRILVADHCRGLAATCKSQQAELSTLRQQIEVLNTELYELQDKLPESGVKDGASSALSQELERSDADALFDAYIQIRAHQNWKFWIFTLLIRPLFSSYTSVVDNSSLPAFLDSIGLWLTQHMSLSVLRPVVTKALVQLYTESSIANEPQALPGLIHTLQTDTNGSDSPGR